MINSCWITEWPSSAELFSLSIGVPLDSKVRVSDLALEKRGFRTINIALFDYEDLEKIRDAINKALKAEEDKANG